MSSELNVNDLPSSFQIRYYCFFLPNKKCFDSLVFSSVLSTTTTSDNSLPIIPFVKLVWRMPSSTRKIVTTGLLLLLLLFSYLKKKLCGQQHITCGGKTFFVSCLFWTFFIRFENPQSRKRPILMKEYKVLIAELFYRLCLLSSEIALTWRVLPRFNECSEIAFRLKAVFSSWWKQLWQPVMKNP